MAKLKDAVVVVGQLALLVGIVGIVIFIANDLEFGGYLNEILAILVAIVLLGLFFAATTCRLRRRGGKNQ